MADPAITVESLLRSGAQTLRQAGIDAPRLDARILLADVLGRDPGSLLPGDDGPVSAEQQRAYAALLARRAVHEPVSRIIGRRAFRGLSLRVSPDTLDPRADSESVVDLALRHLKAGSRVLDLGTGTGCLLLSLLAECEGCSGLGVDRSHAAIQVAMKNATASGFQDIARFRQGDWFDGIVEQFDLIVSNPPYIPAEAIAGLMPDVRDYDPRLALDGGPDGLQAYRAIISDAGTFMTNSGVLVLEIGAEQKVSVVALAARHNLVLVDQQSDLGGHVRGLAFMRSS